MGNLKHMNFKEKIQIGLWFLTSVFLILVLIISSYRMEV